MTLEAKVVGGSECGEAPDFHSAPDGRKEQRLPVTARPFAVRTLGDAREQARESFLVALLLMGSGCE